MRECKKCFEVKPDRNMYHTSKMGYMGGILKYETWICNYCADGFAENEKEKFAEQFNPKSKLKVK